MKLTFVLLTAAILNVSAKGISQQVTFSGKDVSLEKIFQELKEQTGYVFLYSNATLIGARPVTIEVRNMPLVQFLEIIFKGQLLKYSIKSKTVNVSPATAPVFPIGRVNELFFSPITGRVTDSSGIALAGATVMVKSSKNSVRTNEEGIFTINVVEGDVLVISFVGYNAIEYKITPAIFSSIAGNNSNTNNIAFTIRLSAKAESLQETMVVSTGYQQIPKERATGSFAQPNKDLYNNRTSSDVISRLEGITSGLVFNRTLNGAPRLQIRGQSTINADANPLIIVDNFPYDGNINNINPNDIQTVTILKDAAAASIWGARAGNGVIVITTKRGKYNQPTRINFSSFFTVSDKPDLSYNPRFLNSNDFIDLEKQLFDLGFYNRDFTSSTRPPISPVVEILTKQSRGIITPQQSAEQINAYRGIDMRRQLEKYFYQRAKNQQYALSLTGGNITSNYILSIGYDRSEAAQVGNRNGRLTTNFFSSFKPIKQLELSGGINYIQTDARNNSIIGDLKTLGRDGKSLTPYTQFADAQGNYLPLLRDYRDSFVLAAPQRGLLNWQYYPLVEKELADNKVSQKDIRLIAGLKFTIIEGLNVEGIYQHQTGRTANDIYYDARSYYARNLINQFSTVTATSVTVRNIPLGGILQNNSNSFQSNNIRGQLNFSRIFSAHSINAIVGVESREFKGEILNSNTLYGYNRNNDSYTIVDFTRSYTLFPSGSRNIRNDYNIEHSINRFRSFFTNIGYDYKQRYTLSLSGRLDQANLFGVKTNDRQVPLWSAGLKWNIAKESFYHISWLKELQFRTTYGFSGNLLNNGTAYTTALYTSSSSPLFPARYSIQSPGNPELQWEKVNMFNVGIDFHLTNNIVSGSIEYYQKKGTDLIGSMAVPSSTGFRLVTVNYGEMKGKGVDVDLNFNILKQSSFTWSAGLLFSYSTDKVTLYESGANVPQVVGKPVNSLFTFRWAGLDSSNGAPRGYDASGNISANYATLTLAPASQKAYSGRLNPSTFGGIRNVFSFKGFELITNISYKFGYYFLRSSIDYNSLYFGWVGHKDYQNRWQKPGDEQNTTVPSFSPLPVNSFRDQFYAGSEALVTKGDHIRLQDIILSYTFAGFRSTSAFKQVQVGFNASNVGILWRANDFNIDPDLVSADYAPPKIFALSVKVNF